MKAWSYFAQDKLDDAVAAYLRALEEDPNYADALHALAMTYAHQEKFDEAIEVGKRLIEVAPDDELAYTSLSIFYQQERHDRRSRAHRRQGADFELEARAAAIQRVRQRLNPRP